MKDLLSRCAELKTAPALLLVFFAVDFLAIVKPLKNLLLFVLFNSTVLFAQLNI